MNKGQKTETRIKNILKFFKMNEDSISTLMGVVVIVLIAGLIFNYFRSANLKTWQGMLIDQQTPATTTETKPEEKQSDKFIDTYIVVKGDDLWHISEKFYKSGYNYVDIMKENKLSSNGVISAGMELRIPQVPAKKITSIEIAKKIKVIDDNLQTTKNDQPVAILNTTNTNTINIGEYITQKGDSLWNISVRAYGDGFKWTKIYWANKNTIKDPNVIFSKVKLTIPVLSK